MALIAVKPLVVIKRADGSHFHAYQDAVIPDGLDAADVKRLVAEGFLADEGATDGEDEKPAGNASLADWQEYARSHGATEDDLEGVGRDELRDRY